MEATQSSLKDILGMSQTQFIIPYFQRGYVWEKTNWENLLQNLTSENSTYFLGSIITQTLGRNTKTRFYENSVIDGQQRLTTINLMLKALLNSIIKEPPFSKDNINTLVSFLYAKQDNAYDFYNIDGDSITFNTSNNIPKLVPSMYDKKVFNAIMSDSPISQNEKNKSLIYKCYEYFENNIDDEKKRKLLDFINDDNIKCFVDISLTEKDNAQAIFDTTNSTGVSLTCVDIVKNDLFRRIKNDPEKLYKDKWYPLFDEDSNHSFWNTKDGDDKTNLEYLLFAIAHIEKTNAGATIYNPNKGDTYNLLATKYKDYFDSINNQEVVLTSFVDKIVKYGKIYKENLSYDDKESYKYNDYMKRFILTLHKLGATSVLNPIILKILYDNVDESGNIENSKENDVFEQLFELEKLLVRTKITSNCSFAKNDKSKPNAQNFNRTIVSALDKNDINLLLTDDQRKVVFDNDKIKEGLKSIDNSTAAIILFILDLKLKSNKGNNSNDSKTSYPYNYSLEHIMPQEFETYWRLPILQDEHGNQKSDEDKRAYRSERVGWIGNMTIITPNLNAKIKNFPI